MHVLISADMEGATGVTCPADCEPGTEQWQRFRRLSQADVNAAIEGFFDAGADGVLVNEAHSSQRNLLLEDLDPRATMLTGKHKRLTMMEGVERPEIGAVAFVGYHAAAGADGILSHTWLGNSLVGVFLDGERASEGRLNAALAREQGRPVVLVTGDDKTCADADGYAPAAEKVAVKECVSRYAAICLPPARTAELIRSAAAAAPLGERGAARPEPHRMEIEFDAAQLALMTSCVPGVERLDVRRIGFDSPTMTEALQCFRVVASIAAGSTEPTYG